MRRCVTVLGYHRRSSQFGHVATAWRYSGRSQDDDPNDLEHGLLGSILESCLNNLNFATLRGGHEESSRVGEVERRRTQVTYVVDLQPVKLVHLPGRSMALRT